MKFHSAEWFGETGQKAFRYLMKDFGFSVSELPQPPSDGAMPYYTLLFRNKTGQFVILTLAPTKHELDLSFGVNSDSFGQAREIYITEFLRLTAPNVSRKVGWGHSAADLLEEELIRLAELFLKYGHDFLHRYETFWFELERLRTGGRKSAVRQQVA